MQNLNLCASFKHCILFSLNAKILSASFNPSLAMNLTGLNVSVSFCPSFKQNIALTLIATNLSASFKASIAIILTGIIFDSEQFLENVKKRVSSIAPIALYPSVNDFEALAQFANLVLSGEIDVKEY